MPARVAIAAALIAQAVCLTNANKLRQAQQVCERVVSSYRAEPDIHLRDMVVTAMANRASLQVRRHRGRSARRALTEIVAYCGDPPPGELADAARRAQTRIRVGDSARADRRRMRLVAVALLVVSFAPSLFKARRIIQPGTRR